MEKICGNCGLYKDIPQMRGAGCTRYEPIPLMAEDGVFLGYPPISQNQDGCEDWEPESGQYTRMVVTLSAGQIADLPDGKVPPEWLRTTFVDEKSDRPDTDRVFVPLEVFGNLHEQFLCACYDGVPIIRDEGHLYVPASWIIQQQPELEKSITMAVNQVLTATCKSSA